MHLRKFIPRAGATLPALCVIAALAGCIFDSKQPTVNTTRITTTGIPLDSLYPASATPARTVTMFWPNYDPSLGAGAASAVETGDPVNVKDHSSGDIIQYRISTQTYGYWNKDLEFRWNYFLLQSTFLFGDTLPDTAGFARESKDLYGSVHGRDRFTNYFDSVQAPDVRDAITTSAKAGAIGVLIRARGAGDTLEIHRVVEATPAGRAGLKPATAILAVNDSAILGDSASERFSRFVAGDAGESVTLTLLEGGAERRVTMVREKVEFPTVYAETIDGLAYIAITGFTPKTIGSLNTHTEFRAALAATKGAPVTLLDVRDNGGGSLDLTLQMCDEILPSGTVMIRQTQKWFEERAQVPIKSMLVSRATGGGAGEKGTNGAPRKFVLLANGHSASASEIFLIALKEGLGAPVVGMKSFGKGVAQTVQETPGKGLALVTFRKFTSDRGLDYHGVGIPADHVDSSASDAVLAHAVAIGKTLAAAPNAKVGSAQVTRAGRARARAADWNRRQSLPADAGGFGAGAPIAPD